MTESSRTARSTTKQAAKKAAARPGPGESRWPCGLGCGSPPARASTPTARSSRRDTMPPIHLNWRHDVVPVKRDIVSRLRGGRTARVRGGRSPHIRSRNRPRVWAGRRAGGRRAANQHPGWLGRWGRRTSRPDRKACRASHRRIARQALRAPRRDRWHGPELARDTGDVRRPRQGRPLARRPVRRVVGRADPEPPVAVALRNWKGLNSHQPELSGFEAGRHTTRWRTPR
jgi:hypothetical protein